jgi:putative transposase
MSHSIKVNDPEAPLRQRAVQMFRAGQHPTTIAQRVHRSRRWVYHWVAVQRDDPRTRFASQSRAPQHSPQTIARQLEYRIVRLRQSLERHGQPRLRYAPVGARTIQRELAKRRVKPLPSLSTIERVLRRHGLTHPPIDASIHAYRPHPAAEYSNAVQATDIVTRWLTGGEVVQTITTVDHFTNTAFATPHPTKRVDAIRAHLLKTWEIMGIPDLAQFDNESAFRGGRHPHQLSTIVRLCLYVGAEVLFTPEYEADYNWVVETFNNFWAHQCWAKHRFTSRAQLPGVFHRFLKWYDTDYVAPRQADTPHRLRHGSSRQHLPHRLSEQIPTELPICQGQVHAIRRVNSDGCVMFLNEPFRVGQRYHDRYVWLTLNTAKQTLMVYYQANAKAEWRSLKAYPYPLSEPVRRVPRPFTNLHI